jgi:outer membrane protein
MKIIATALLMGLALAQPALAADLKVGFVNTERVFRDSALSAKAQKKLEKEFSARDQELQKQIKQARDLQASLEKEALTLSETERAKKERDLANLNRDIQRTQREFREDLNQRKNEEFAGIHEKARRIILDIAKKEDFDLIVENAVYASGRVDITDKVLKALER